MEFFPNRLMTRECVLTAIIHDVSVAWRHAVLVHAPLCSAHTATGLKDASDTGVINALVSLGRNESHGSRSRETCPC